MPIELAALLIICWTVEPGLGGVSTLSSGVSQIAATVSSKTPMLVLERAWCLVVD